MNGTIFLTRNIPIIVESSRNKLALNILHVMAGDVAKAGVTPSTGARFEVKLVPHDTREEETLHAALDALVQLSEVANNTFNRISDRFPSIQRGSYLGVADLEL